MWQGYLVFSTEQSDLAYLLEGAIKEFRDFEATNVKCVLVYFISDSQMNTRGLRVT